MEVSRRPAGRRDRASPRPILERDRRGLDSVLRPRFAHQPSSLKPLGAIAETQGKEFHMRYLQFGALSGLALLATSFLIAQLFY